MTKTLDPKSVRVAANPGVPLIVAALCAPLTAVSRRWPGAYHAADMDEVIRSYVHGRTITAPCGAKRLRLLVSGKDKLLVRWPVRVKGLPDGWRRCSECWEATGRKSPVSTFKAVA